MSDRTVMRKLIVEFIGTFTLIFAGCGAIVATQGLDIVAIALAHGLAIGLMITAAGHISGGHFNPAVTTAMVATRRIDPRTALFYVVAQLLGGVAGAGALTLIFRDLERNAVNLGMPAVGANLTSGNALAAEIILTFFLVFVIFGTAVDDRTPKAITGLAIGLTITMDIFVGANVSGAAMNPARWFGPAVVQNDFNDFWIWIVGPIIGALIAGVLFNDILLDRGTPAAVKRPSRAATPDEDEEYEPTVEVERSRRSQRRKR